MVMNREQLRQIVEAIPDPHTGEPLGGAVRGLGVQGGGVAVDIHLGYPAAGWQDALVEDVRTALAGNGAERVTVDVGWSVAPHAVQGDLAPLPAVKNVIAVASGKGGVGKSTVAANLALALAAEGARVGVLDADIYGPSQPRMLGLSGQPAATPEKKILPLEAHGLQAISIGVLVKADQAMIWRGPMVSQALQQMFGETLWDNLDYLVVDLPPGTGDIQLTLAQKVPVSGSVVVTTPQAVAVDDVRRAVAMFNRVKVPVLGIVENMSSHICSACGHEEALFGHGGGRAIAEEMAQAFLGEVPLNASLGRSTDAGRPSVIDDPQGAVAQRFREIARRTAARLSLQPRNEKISMPKIKITG